MTITNDNFVHAELGSQSGKANPCSSCPINDNLGLLQILPQDLSGINQPSQNDNSGPVLIIMENRYVHDLPQRPLNLKTTGSSNILHIDRSEVGSVAFNGLDLHIDVLAAVDADGNDVDVAEVFE